MQTQYSVLGYRTDLYFHYYKLAIQTNETDHSDGNIDYEIKRKKATEQELVCEFLRIDLDKKDFDFFEVINEIFRNIKQLPNESTKKSTKKTIIDKTSMRLLGIEFKSNNMTKSKTIKYVVKRILLILPDYE